MSQENAKGLRGFLSASALSPYAVVQRDANGKAALCGAGQTPMGSLGADRITAADKHVTVRMMSYAGTRKLIGALAITAGQKVYPAASGKVTNVPSRDGEQARWFALETSTAADELIECADFYGEDVSDEFTYVKGGAGGIAAQDLVYSSAQVGAVPTVLKAQATAGGKFASHFAPAAIAEDAFDEVVKSYLLVGTASANVNTGGSTVGDPVFLSDGTAGGWTLTKPTATDKVQVVGRVVTVHATLGAIQFDLSGVTQIVHTHTSDAEGGDLGHVLGVASGYKVARGQHTTVAASDTVVTGLATVVAAVANFEDAPSLDPLLVQAVIGDQAGSPAAGSIYIKTWKPTAAGDVTPLAATTFAKKVNWIAIGT